MKWMRDIGIERGSIACLVLALMFSSVYAQMEPNGQFLQLSDPTELQGIEGADIRLVGEVGDQKKVVFRGLTDSQGRWLLPKGWKTATQIFIQREGYETLRLSIGELKQSGFQLFLDPQEYALDAVIFSAGKFKERQQEVVQKVAVISAKDIAFRNPATSADLLEQQGEVFVQRSQMGGGSPNLRGFEANKVLLVLDGVRMNNAIYRSGHLQNVLTIDPALVERAEIIFGPGSVIYGSDALGGVMHLYTRKPVLSQTGKLESKVRFTSRYGSANQEKHLHADLNLGGEKWGFLSSISLTDFGNLRTGKQWAGEPVSTWLQDSLVQRVEGEDRIVAHADPYVFSPTAYRQWDVGQKVLFVPNATSSHELNLQYSTSTDIPRYDRLVQLHNDRLRYAEWYYGPQERLLAAYTLKIKQKARLYDQLSLVGAYQFVQESRHNRDFQDDWRSNRTESLDIFSFNLDATKRIRPQHSLSYGTEFVWNGVRSVAEAENIRTGETEALDTRYPDGGSEYQTAALYLTHKWKLTERWSLRQGVRLTRVQLIARFADTSFYAFPYSEIVQPSQSLSGSIGTVYQGTKGWQVRASLANGFRAPNLDDVAKIFDSQPGNVVVPNPELEPEYTYNLELGVEKAWDKGIRLGVTGFATYYDNAIVVRNFSIAGADSLLYEGVLSQVQANVNAQEAYYWGFHQFVAGKWGKWQASHRVSFTYGQSFEAQGSVPMDHVPPLFGQGVVAYQSRRWRAEGTVKYQTAKDIRRYSPRDFGDLWYASPEGSPAWWVLHLKTSFQLHSHLRLQAGVDNLLDRHYRAYSSRISAPGRNLYLALRGQW